MIRAAKPEDAERLLALHKTLDAETKFMLFEPGERTTTVEDERRRLERIEESSNEAVFVAEVDEAIVGFTSGFCRPPQRVRHAVYIVLGIARSHWGQGLGTALLGELEAWARERG